MCRVLADDQALPSLIFDKGVDIFGGNCYQCFVTNDPDEDIQVTGIVFGSTAIGKAALQGEARIERKLVPLLSVSCVKR